MRVGIAIAAVALAVVGCGDSGHTRTTGEIRDRAAADHHWEPDDIEIGRFTELDRGGCDFYRASNPRVLDAWSYPYVVLPGGELAGDPSPVTAAQVLRICGTGADATWQARVVTNFGGSVPGIVVDADNVGSAERVIQDAGAEFFPPRSADRTVTFYARNFDAGTIHLVRAELPEDGPVDIGVEQIVGR